MSDFLSAHIHTSNSGRKQKRRKKYREAKYYKIDKNEVATS
jgi:hypothetical protein